MFVNLYVVSVVFEYSSFLFRLHIKLQEEESAAKLYSKFISLIESGKVSFIFLPLDEATIGTKCILECLLYS